MGFWSMTGGGLVVEMAMNCLKILSGLQVIDHLSGPYI